MKYCIVLISNYTGDEVHLGSKYQSREDAQKTVDSEVCLRCNGFSIREIPDDFMWRNKTSGFVEPNRGEGL